LHRGLPGIEAMRPVATDARELLILRPGVHGLARPSRRHRRESLGEAHAVLAGEKAPGLPLVAALAGLVTATLHPGLGSIRCFLGAPAAVDARFRVGGREPVGDRVA